MQDIMDYWSGAGYGQIPQETQYQPTGSLGQAPWENADTYAPFGSDGVQAGEISPSQMGGSYRTGDNLFSWPLISWGLMKGSKKRRPPNFSAPSYQGEYFTPNEGLPEYYQQSQESNQNQTQQDYYSQMPQLQSQSYGQMPSSQSYDYNYGGELQSPQSNPQYINQSLYDKYGGEDPYAQTFKASQYGS